MAILDSAALTTNVLNYSGLLRSKSDNTTRLLNKILTTGKNGGMYDVSSVEFTLSSGFSNRAGKQPAITESASLTAPNPTSVTRDQQTNVVQIFQEAVAVSYLKQSASGMMGGINVAGQENNVPDELLFQINAKMADMTNDLSYSIIKGSYAKVGESSATAYKTRGLIEGITTNATALGDTDLFTRETLNTAITEATENGFIMTAGMQIFVNPADLAIINKVYTEANGYALPASTSVGGQAIKTIITDFGQISVDYDKDIDKGTLLMIDPTQMAIVGLPTPSKGNFFYEELAKTGAAEKGQLYAQAGLDYGAEWGYLKITGLKTEANS